MSEALLCLLLSFSLLGEFLKELVSETFGQIEDFCTDLASHALDNARISSIAFNHAPLWLIKGTDSI